MAKGKHDNPAQERYKVARPPRFTLHHGRNLLYALRHRPDHPDIEAWLKKNSVTLEQLTRRA